MGSDVSLLELSQKKEEQKLQEAVAAQAEGRLPVQAGRRAGLSGSGPGNGGPLDTASMFGAEPRRRRPKPGNIAS